MERMDCAGRAPAWRCIGPALSPRAVLACIAALCSRDVPVVEADCRVDILDGLAVWRAVAAGRVGGAMRGPALSDRPFTILAEEWFPAAVAAPETLDRVVCRAASTRFPIGPGAALWTARMRAARETGSPDRRDRVGVMAMAVGRTVGGPATGEKPSPGAPMNCPRLKDAVGLRGRER